MNTQPRNVTYRSRGTAALDELLFVISRFCVGFVSASLGITGGITMVRSRYWGLSLTGPIAMLMPIYLFLFELSRSPRLIGFLVLVFVVSVFGIVMLCLPPVRAAYRNNLRSRNSN